MKQVERKITIMTGGTGGHVFPGIAVAKAFQKQGAKVTWLGANGLERELVPKAGIKLTSLPIDGIRGNGIMGWIQLPFKLLRAVMSARRYLKDEQPDCVIGFGGFASAPGGIAAKTLGIPLVIHEQNGVAGLANRLLSHFSALILMGFKDVFKQGVFVGNPVREEFAHLGDYAERIKKRDDEYLNILVLGGSQGARAVNRLIASTMPQVKRNCRVWHQTGKALYDESIESWNVSGIKPYRIAPFIDDMPQAYGWADIVICRSGALTVAELLVANVASLLIPFPYAVDDHQTKNGESLVENGAALLYQEDQLNGEKLATIIDHLSSADLIEMAENGKSLAKPTATDAIVEAVEKVIKGEL